MKTTLTLLSIIISTIVTGQNTQIFHSLCNQASYQIQQGDLSGAQLNLIQAFAMNGIPRAADHFNLAKCYSQMNDAEKTKKQLQLALQKNPSIKNAIKSHHLWFQDLLGEASWLSLLEFEENISAEKDAQITEILDKCNQIVANVYKLYRIIYNKKIEGIIVSHAERDSLQAIIVDSIAPELDLLLETTPIELLKEPRVEMNLYSTIKNLNHHYSKKRQSMLEDFILKGVWTYDLLLWDYAEDYFKEGQQFIIQSYQPHLQEFYSTYGICYDQQMLTWRFYSSYDY